MRKRAICWYAPSLSCWFQTLFVYIVKYLLILLVLTINFYYCCCRYCSINLLASHWITYKFKVQSSNDPKQVRERERRGPPSHSIMLSTDCYIAWKESRSVTQEQQYIRNLCICSQTTSPRFFRQHKWVFTSGQWIMCWCIWSMR